MKNSELAKQSLAYSLGTVSYVFLVAWLMSNGDRLFGKVDNVLSGVAVLLLVVLSAAVTGSLVFGKPVLMYLDGKKKEAVKTLCYTLGWLFFWLMIFFSLMLAIR